jgi:hypothetical protein
MSLEVCWEHNISDVTVHRWKRKYGDFKLDGAQRFEGPERENGESWKSEIKRFSFN